MPCCGYLQLYCDLSKPQILPQSLILVLDGDLNRVPFAALRFSDREYMGLHHDLVRAPSAAFLLQGIEPRPAPEFPKSVLALYDPIFAADDPRPRLNYEREKDLAHEHFARLPFNEELKTIARSFPEPVLTLWASRCQYPGLAEAATGTVWYSAFFNPRNHQ